MSIVTEICNIALSHIGCSRISSIDEAKKEARECKVLYEAVRDSVLRDHMWGFATKHLQLALLPDEYKGWDYAYTYPVDCLAARYIYNSASKTKKIPFKILANKTLTGVVLATDQQDAILFYTAKIVELGGLDSQFRDAFAWRLAADLAIPLKDSSNKQGNAMKMYYSIISAAQASDANEEYEKPDYTSSYVEGR